MPTVYKRKNNNRAAWSESDLETAVEKILDKTLSIRAASKLFKIPATTIRRRMTTQNFKKESLGSSSCLGSSLEAKIVEHIKKLQQHGFAPTRSEVCQIFI